MHSWRRLARRTCEPPDIVVLAYQRKNCAMAWRWSLDKNRSRSVQTRNSQKKALHDAIDFWSGFPDEEIRDDFRTWMRRSRKILAMEPYGPGGDYIFRYNISLILASFQFRHPPSHAQQNILQPKFQSIAPIFHILPFPQQRLPAPTGSLSVNQFKLLKRLTKA